MSNRWIVTESGDLLNLDRVREVLMDCDSDGEYSVTAYDSDPLHQENMWVLYSTTSQEDARAFMSALERGLQARTIEVVEGKAFLTTSREES